MSKRPMQPIVLDEHGVIRFEANAIVAYLLDHGSIDLNDLALRQIGTREDWSQLYQLIGYSVSGFGGLDEASPEEVDAADEAAERLLAGEEID